MGIEEITQGAGELTPEEQAKEMEERAKRTSGSFQDGLVGIDNLVATKKTTGSHANSQSKYDSRLSPVERNKMGRQQLQASIEAGKKKPEVLPQKK